MDFWGGGEGTATTCHYRFVNVNLPMLGLICISPYSVQIRENTDYKKLRIWILFLQCKNVLVLTRLTELTHLIPMHHPFSTPENKKVVRLLGTNGLTR